MILGQNALNMQTALRDDMKMQPESMLHCTQRSYCVHPESMSECARKPCQNALRIPLRVISWSRMHKELMPDAAGTRAHVALHIMQHIEVLPWCTQAPCLNAFRSAIRKHSDTIWECTQGPCQNACRTQVINTLRSHARVHSESMLHSEAMSECTL